MSERYSGKIVSVQDKFTVVANKGSSSGIKHGDKFLIVGLGDVIKDPETNEELEQLEIVRGKAVVSHVQEKIATLNSCDYKKSSDIREIKKVTTKVSSLLSIMGPQDVVTESTKPGEEILREFSGVRQGDLLIKL